MIELMKQREVLTEALSKAARLDLEVGIHFVNHAYIGIETALARVDTEIKIRQGEENDR